MAPESGTWEGTRSCSAPLCVADFPHNRQPLGLMCMYWSFIRSNLLTWDCPAVHVDHPCVPLPRFTSHYISCYYLPWKCREWQPTEMPSARHQSDTVVKHWASPPGSGNWFFCKSQRLGCEWGREGGDDSWEGWDEIRLGHWAKMKGKLMFSTAFINVQLPFACIGKCIKRILKSWRTSSREVSAAFHCQYFLEAGC